MTHDRRPRSQRSRRRRAGERVQAVLRLFFTHGSRVRTTEVLGTQAFLLFQELL